MKISDRQGMMVCAFRTKYNLPGGLRVSWTRWINEVYYHFTVDTFDDGRRQVEVWRGSGSDHKHEHLFKLN